MVGEKGGGRGKKGGIKREKVKGVGMRRRGEMEERSV